MHRSRRHAPLICHCEEAAGRRGNLGKAVTILPGLSCDPAGYCEIATAPLGPRNDTSGWYGGAPAPLRGLIALYKALTERRYRPRRNRFHFNDSLCVSTALRREGHAPPVREAAIGRPIRCNAPFPAPCSPDMSLRGAKRRGNLGKAVTILPGLSCDPAGNCEIATAPSGPRNDTSGGCGSAPAPLRGLIALYRALTERRYRPRRNRFHFNDSLCVSTALRRARLSPPLQWRVRSTMVPGNLQLPMAVTTRKGHAASVRRQSRQRLRSDRRYRRNRCMPF